MPHLRLALNQIDATVGALDHNGAEIVQWTRYAVERGADLVAFPELVLTGCPVEDLAARGDFRAASRAALTELAGQLREDGLGETPVVVGYLDELAPSSSRPGKPAGAQSRCALLHGGTVLLSCAKRRLPWHGAFDDYRYFVGGERCAVTQVRGMDVVLGFGSDLGPGGDTARAARDAGAGLLLTLDAAPYGIGTADDDTSDAALATAARAAAEAGCAVARVNLVGGQDEFVFAGDSLAVAADGQPLARAPRFEQHCLLLDVELPSAASSRQGAAAEHVADGLPVDRVTVPDAGAPASGTVDAALPISQVSRLDDTEALYTALLTSLRGYVHKNGFRSLLVALSGGIDSALTAALAADAVDGEHVFGVSMPSDYSSSHSQSDAADLAQRCGLHFRTVPIATLVASFQEALALSGVAEENLQARVRGTALMGISNQEGHLVLAPGNHTELACGYSTLYGDAVGGFAPLKDVSKTQVWALSLWRNDAARKQGVVPPIPENSISKPPSAELRPGQLDSDSLPDYEVLDAILERHLRRGQGRQQLVEAGFSAELVDRVLRMVRGAEYKRRQYPPGPKLFLQSHGWGRQLPMTNRWRDDR